MHLTNLNSVVSKEIIDNERQVLAHAEEAKHLAVLIEELLLAGYFAATERFFHEFFKVILGGTRTGNLGCLNWVSWGNLSIRLSLSQILNRAKEQRKKVS